MADRWLGAATASLAQVRAKAANPAAARWITMAAAAGFAIGLAVSIWQLPHDLGPARLDLLAWLAFVCGPPMILANVLETRLCARAVGYPFGWLAATRISIVSSAANMLPLPGGPIVRVGAMTLAGARLGASVGITLAVAVLWLGLSVGYGGLWLLDGPHRILGFVLLGCGIILVPLAFCWIRALRNSWRIAFEALVIKAFATGIGLVRVWIAFAALGIVLDLADVSVFAIAGVAGSAVAIVPAGLGVNEAVNALIAVAVEQPASAGFLSSTLSRVVGMAVMLPLALALGMRRSPWGGSHAQ